jgi:uncharacterized protein (DUF1330 family)
MAVYMIAEINVKDEKSYAEYRTRAPATVRQYGGRYLVRGGRVTACEGTWNPVRLVVLEFPSMEHFRRWYNSPEYRQIAPLRIQATESQLIVAEGYQE